MLYPLHLELTARPGGQAKLSPEVSRGWSVSRTFGHCVCLTLAPVRHGGGDVCLAQQRDREKHRWVYPALYFGFVFVLTAPFLVAGNCLPPLATGLPAVDAG